MSFLLALIFASLVGFKIYFGIFAFVGIAFVSLYFLIKKQYKRLILPIASVLFALLLYLPVNNGASGLSFVGTWRFENFVVQRGFGLSHLELARQVYLSHDNYLRVLEYELIYVFLYFVFVFGTLNLGFLQNRKSLRLLPKELHIFLISSIAVCLIIGFFFFQKISGANTSQFIITAEIISIIYVALVCSVFFNKNRKIGILFLILLFLFTTPRVINQSRANFQAILAKRGVLISNSEIQALDFLNKKTPNNSLILSDNNRVRNEKECYYIGFLSNRAMFICDAKGIVADHGVDITKRQNDYEVITTNFYKSGAMDRLISNKIDYIYTVSDKKVFNNDTGDLKTVFINDRIRIIKVIR